MGETLHLLSSVTEGERSGHFTAGFALRPPGSSRKSDNLSHPDIDRFERLQRPESGTEG